MYDERPPICPACGVTMVPAALSARNVRGVEWICLECEETAEPDGTWDSASFPNPGAGLSRTRLELRHAGPPGANPSIT